MIRQANLFTSVFSTVSYIYALLSLTSYWLFLVPSESLPTSLHGHVYSMDLARTSPNLFIAILADIGLMLLFTIPHSILARAATKLIMNLPVCVERPLFVLQAAALLHAQMHYWQNFEAPNIWNISGSVAQTSLWALFVAGYLFLVTASFALDHFHLFGLSQGTGVNINRKIGLAPPTSQKLVARWHYSIVAHPIMTGILTFLWATPIMSAPHFLLSTCMTLYILSAVILLEEPSLKQEIGKDYYEEYLQSVPRFCPMTKNKKISMFTADISLCPHFQQSKLAQFSKHIPNPQ
jgi:protein-S-isoprenylcysteine O-methyltransferase Ste14